MGGPYLIGTDIGTSACKSALFSIDGTVISSSSVPYPLFTPRPGWAEQNPEDWFGAACASIRSCLETSGVSPSDVAGVGIDGQSWAAVAVDRDGKVLCPSPIWMDTRSADICRDLSKKIPDDYILNMCGNPLTSSYTTGKILWYRDNLPDVFSSTHKILQSNSFVIYRLTGKITQDPSQGYGLHCYNMREQTWDSAAAEALGIPLKMLPDIFPCSSVIGTVTGQASMLCGLEAGTPVVAGGVDSACASLGAGVINDGDTQEQGGQSGGMSIFTEQFCPHPALITCSSVTGSGFLLQGGTTGGGGTVRWMSRQISGMFGQLTDSTSPDPDSLPAEFDRMASSISPGCDGLVFLPYMSGERTPVWDPDAKGVFYGIDYSKTAAHFLRSVMEGVAYSLRHNLDTAAAAGCGVKVLRATGGSANSQFWTQMKSDATGLPVSVPGSDNSTGLGAAMLAGVGTGVYADFSEAVSITVRETRRHEPDLTKKPFYDRTYSTYLELSSRLKGLSS